MNSFGRIFRVSVVGESHGEIVGILIDGCPPGIKINQEDFLLDLERRKPKVVGTTLRKEDDVPMIKSGVYNGYSSGAPILIEIENKNKISKDYDNLKSHYRPGHADFTAYNKYNGFNDPRGGGHFSGRLTAALVVAGVIAKKVIPHVEIKANIEYVGGLKDYEQLVENTSEAGDSLGGIVYCEVNNLPIGIGEPFFDSLESVISHLVFSIPAVKGIEFGRGFQSANIYGSEMNDIIIDNLGTSKTNNAGGINGGISNGNTLYFRVAIKPASSIAITQQTYNSKTKQVEELEIKGRHDSAIVLRVPPVLEAVTAIALTDLMFLAKLYS